jgi:23S rRNA pseudouridine1911/1915/1917 synthase
MDIKIIHEDNDVLVIDKPAKVIVFPEGDISGEKTLIDYLIEKYPRLTEAGSPPRYGIVHRLDKDTSGILLVAKTSEALNFLQKQFSAPSSALKNKESGQTLEKTIEKRYIALVVGNIKDEEKTIHTLIGRAPGDKRKQKVYLVGEPGSIGKREAITKYKVINRYKNYTLLEVDIKTGRRHQIRCHLSYIHHPIAGDKMYGFKDSPAPEGLGRQFLHATYLKIQLPDSEIKEFISELPEELKNILKKIKPQ